MDKEAQAQVDRLCDLYEVELRGSGEPDLAEYVRRADSGVRSELLIELLKLEAELLSPQKLRGKAKQLLNDLPQYADEILSCLGEISSGDTDDPEHTADTCQQETLGEQLSHHPTSAGAERRTYAHFSFPGRGSC